MPNIGGALSVADGPAAVLPDGNVLVAVSPGVFNNPTHFVEVQVASATSVTITQVDEPASAADQSSWESRMLVLPTGEVLWTSDVGDVQIYTPKGKARESSDPDSQEECLRTSRAAAPTMSSRARASTA